MTFNIYFGDKKNEVDLIQLFFMFAMVMVISGVEFLPFLDIWHDGKIRWMCFSLCPVIFYSLMGHSIWLAIFCAYVFGSWTASVFPVVGIIDMVSILACSYLAAAIYKSVKMEKVIDLIGWSGVANAIIGFAQMQRLPFPYYSGDVEFYKVYGYSPLGMMGNPRMLAPLIGMTIIWAICKKKAFWILVFPLSYILYECHATAATVPTVMAVLYLASRKNKWAGISLSILCSIALALVLKFKDLPIDMNGRQLVWPVAWNIFTQNFYLGTCPGYWFGYYSDHKVEFNKMWSYIHNEPLTGLVEYGVAGMTPIFCSVSNLVMKHFNLPASLVGFSIIIVGDSFGNFLLHLPAYGLIICYILVALQGAKERLC